MRSIVAGTAQPSAGRMVLSLPTDVLFDTAARGSMASTGPHEPTTATPAAHTTRIEIIWVPDLSSLPGSEGLKSAADRS